ncbi:pyridoxal phosphate-dependent transferase [Cokeromyces recurvatus]|uniref:pyridoxal phosphate-dependent transferase n=1 Tax=Cokeromyces recurvatus TaxID=90255 RepID=UPI00221E401A|nr:pyridoxal phosphate-dependent transferase [Cokeromyces recurvatus]KAI7901020.1 pyridoxal phosphate-dependent transferase [Cokeromyces recurvatus]
MTAFFNRYFEPYYLIEPEHISVQTGAGASVNQLYLNICDEGEYCMIPGPYYGAFDLDVSVQTGVKIIEVFPHTLTDMTVDGNELERVYQKTKSEGKRITSILITNPDNPLGRCYSRKDLETYLIFASNHNLHIVFDEIYALSTYSHIVEKTDKSVFISALSLDYKKLIHPSLVHVIYGMSKDFALNGFRVGFIIDQFNENLRKALSRSSIFSYTSTITDRLLCNWFKDERWIDEYILENRQALADNYIRTTQYLKEHQINFIPGEAGLFFLIDIRSLLKKNFNEITHEDEKYIWHTLIDHGVYMAPSFVFHSKIPGFFRLTFAIPWEILEKGLDNIIETFANIQ